MSHIQKWKEVCDELKLNHPKSNVTLWVSGYVSGLTHVADMESRSRSIAAGASKTCTPNLLPVNQEGAE